jgi:hypothetical protein
MPLMGAADPVFGVGSGVGSRWVFGWKICETSMKSLSLSYIYINIYISDGLKFV